MRKIRSSESRLLRAWTISAVVYLFLIIYMLLPAGALSPDEPKVKSWVLNQEGDLFENGWVGRNAEGFTRLSIGDIVSPLAWVSEAKGNVPNMVQVRTEFGEIGFIREGLLNETQHKEAWKLPRLRMNHLFKTSYETFSESVFGQPLSTVLLRYGPITSSYPADEPGRQVIHGFLATG